MTRTILIQVAGGKVPVDVEAPYGSWEHMDSFYYDGERYSFLGRDRVGGLHAKRFRDGRGVVFDSSAEWVPV